MQVSRLLRRWVSAGVLMAMLFMQLATAAYACPQLEKARQQAAMALAMPGCEGMAGSMDLEQPQLCKAHCDRDAQGTAASASADLQPNPAALTLMLGVVQPLVPLLPACVRAGQAPLAARSAGEPPLYLSLLVLRN
ncbi:MAG TPA: hypothetical protein VK195_17870 [Burkholderiaceae bacterium]|nr:hypothetical protein [Burkholderiaceae bacterium]